VVVTGDQGCVYIDVVPTSDGGGDGGITGSSTGRIQNQLLSVQ
jgi:hypothetical protein